eukprot:TRINITY_DN51440_c0_g1_i1.p2 TRINITY_DN51440_c0_g1~~TRINITY_DN51440_c0_g1_i1.p2  ORF type:complete len:324 (+),score=115.20 TRINITY_DN51440_c0_g1_i1:70-972(+)
MADCEAELAVLRAAAVICTRRPALLQLPECAFFREFILAQAAVLQQQLPRYAAGPGYSAAAAPAAADGHGTPTARLPAAADAPASGRAGGRGGGGLPVSAFSINSLFSCRWSDGESSDDDVPPQHQPPQAPDEDDPEGMTDGPCPEVPAPQRLQDPEPDDVTERALLRSAELAGEAQYLASEGHLSRALAAIGEAISMNPGQALLYVERAEIHLRMRRPNAAVRDCDAALRINPDSAGAHKVRGRAFRMLKNWELSAHHMRLGNQLVYDGSSYALQKRVEGKVKERRLEEVRQRTQSQDG